MPLTDCRSSAAVRAEERKRGPHRDRLSDCTNLLLSQAETREQRERTEIHLHNWVRDPSVRLYGHSYAALQFRSIEEKVLFDLIVPLISSTRFVSRQSLPLLNPGLTQKASK